MKREKFGEVFKKGLLKESELIFKIIDPPPGAPPLYNIRCEFRNGKWQEPKISKSRHLHLRIEAGCLHYGHEWFEGLAAHATKDGRCLLFRPKENALRAESSSKIICMETVPSSLFQDCVCEAVRQNAAYVPRYGTGGRLYLRPFLIGTNPQLGLGESYEFAFVIFAYPVGNYYPTGLKPMKLYCSPAYDRVAERGTGKAKAGGNYVASYTPKKAAKNKNCGEFLYLDIAQRQYIIETGSSNFVALRADRYYITPDESAVLWSITNDSLAKIAEEIMGFKVQKRRLALSELKVKRGSQRFLETALCGTAARLTPVKAIVYENKFGRNRKEIPFPNVGESAGPWCQELYDHLVAIQHGDEEDRWGWTEEVKL